MKIYETKFVINDLPVYVTAGELSKDEVREYTHRAFDKFGDELKEMRIKVDGDYIDVTYVKRKTKPFVRLRRITGYLVGTLDSWNDAKRAEESDRVKHER